MRWHCADTSAGGEQVIQQHGEQDRASWEKCSQNRYYLFGSKTSKPRLMTCGVAGEQLESIHVARQRAQAAHDLIDYYNQFSKGDTQQLDSLRKDGGKAGRRQVAIVLRRLLTVAKEVDLPDAQQVRGRLRCDMRLRERTTHVWNQTRDRIDKYCEQFEKDMLRLFDKSYRKGDPNMMGVSHQV